MEENNRMLEDSLLTWILQLRQKYNDRQLLYRDVSLTLHVFKQKLKLKTPFNPSKGWFNEYKYRYKLQNMAVKKAVSEEPLAYFRKIFLHYIHDKRLCPAQVYIADEGGLNWRFLMDNTDDNPEMITFLTCTNVTGQHKLKPMVVGKVKNPKALRDIDLPIHYYTQKYAWINREIFKKWFFECFVPEVEEWLRKHDLPNRALLLIDSASCHPTNACLVTKNGAIAAILIPILATEKQPIQNILDYIKYNYKASILRTISQRKPSDRPFNFNLLDMAFLLFECWRSTPTSLILSVWDSLNTGEACSPPYEVTNTQPAYVMMAQICEKFDVSPDYITTWYKGEGEEKNGSHFLSVDEICATAPTLYLEGDEEEGGGAAPVQPSKKLTPDQTINAIEYCIRWAEKTGYCCSEIALLRRMRVNVLSIPRAEPELRRVKTEVSEEEGPSKRIKFEKDM